MEGFCSLRATAVFSPRFADLGWSRYWKLSLYCHRMVPSWGQILQRLLNCAKCCLAVPGCTNAWWNITPDHHFSLVKITAISEVAQDDFLNFHSMQVNKIPLLRGTQASIVLLGCNRVNCCFYSWSLIWCTPSLCAHNSAWYNYSLPFVDHRLSVCKWGITYNLLALGPKCCPRISVMRVLSVWLRTISNVCFGHKKKTLNSNLKLSDEIWSEGNW